MNTPPVCPTCLTTTIRTDNDPDVAWCHSCDEPVNVKPQLDPIRAHMAAAREAIQRAKDKR